MQTITPNDMLSTMIVMFTESPEVRSFELMLLDITWLHNTEATDAIETVMKKLTWLDTFTSQMEGITRSFSSSETGLTVELRLREGDRGFEHTTCREIQDCLFSAYGRKVSAKAVGPAYFAVLIRDAKTSKVISTALADFRPFPDIEFATRMEAVSKPWQGKKVSKGLFTFIEATVRFLVTIDVFVRMNMAGLEPGAMTIKSCVDADAPEWHSEMMGKLGFQDISCDWADELEFSKSVE